MNERHLIGYKRTRFGYRSRATGRPMIWFWTHDERGEELLTAQEVYADISSYPEIDARESLIESIQKFLWVAGVTAA